MSTELCMYEGYIRNRKALLSELCLEEGDYPETERNIIIEGYKRWKKELPLHLYGSFSFVIRDRENEEYFCSRDAFGIESFYYYISEKGEFIFSNDIKTITDNPEYKKDIDPLALQLYFMFGYPAGERTLFKGIKKLLTGRNMIVDKKAQKTEIWFKPVFNPDKCQSLEDSWLLDIMGFEQSIL